MEIKADLAGLEELLTRAAREGARLALAERTGPTPWLSVESAAVYADMTEDAIRSAEKRGQVKAHRSVTGRIVFWREDLDRFLRGELPVEEACEELMAA